MAQSIVEALPAPPAVRVRWLAAKGVVAGALVWAAFALWLQVLPSWLRFLVVAAVFLFGPGAAATYPLLASIPWFSRITLALAFGMATAPVVIHGLAAIDLVNVYPYLAAALTGGVLAYWAGLPRIVERRARPIAPLLLAVLTLTVASIAFANRITENADATVIYGEYDTFDTTYYAAIAAELTHTIPPSSPFYAGHALNQAFYPHLVLAVVHRFADVPLLDLYFRYAWPAFLLLAALSCFVLVQRIASTRAAFLATTLLIVGSDLSYIAAWFFRPAVGFWDDVVWSANFTSPGAETLLFNNWTPALCVVFAGLYALAAHEESPRVGWLVAAGGCFAVSAMFKPFAFGLLLAGLALAAVASRRDQHARRFMTVLVISLVFSVPYVYRMVTLAHDAPATLKLQLFPLPRVMFARLGLYDGLLQRLSAIGIDGTAQIGLAGIIATPVFLVGGLGFRLAGLSHLWRCLRRPGQEAPIWRMLAWTIVAAIGIPFFVVSVPYHEVMHFHQFALFLLALFVGRALGALNGRRAQIIATAVVIAVAAPSTAHYLHRKWTDKQRPYAQVTASERPVVALLSDTDPERTVLLHNRPSRSNLITILARRRSVLAWSPYERGSDERRKEIDYFFRSSGGSSERAMAVLDQYRPTHVLEYRKFDRINSDALARLKLVFQNEDVALYAFPAPPQH